MSHIAALSLDDFALFRRVAELRSFSAVAREREVPPSQVSRALNRIEGLCGARLVHRSTHGLSLTDEGERFLAHAARLLLQAEALDAELQLRRAEPSGLVRLATSPVIALALVPALEPLLQRHPRLRIDLLADDRLLDIAREGIDIALRTGTPGADGLVARAIGRHDRTLFASPAYAAAHGLPEHPDELARHQLIGNSASPVMNRWRFIVEGQPRELKVAGALRTDNTGVALAMALQGLGIVRINEASAAAHVAAGRLLPVLGEYLERTGQPMYAVMLPDRQRLPKVRVCVEHFAQWFGAFA